MCINGGVHTPGMTVGKRGDTRDGDEERTLVGGNRVVSGMRQTTLSLPSAAVIRSTIARMASVGSSLGRVCIGISG